MTAILVAESIGKSFGSSRVLTAARLEAHEGTITFVAGRNGAGKSTLLKVSAGFLSPDYGTVRFRGELFRPARLHGLAREGLFYLPDRDILSPSFTVRQQLEEVRGRFNGRDVPGVAEEVGIREVLDQKPGTLSGGERRRAEVALALVRRPRCLIADEPLRGIDPKDRERLISCLQTLAHGGAAVVVSGHEMQDLLEASDTVVWVTAGTSYDLGSPRQALLQERFRREYLTGSWI